MKIVKLVLLCMIHIMVFGYVSVSGQTTSSVKGRIVGASQGHGLRVILSNENVLLDVSPDSQNNFIFEDVEQGEYVLKVNGIGRRMLLFLMLANCPTMDTVLNGKKTPAQLARNTVHM